MPEPIEAYQGEPRLPSVDTIGQDKQIFAAGVAAEHPYGVLYQGEHETLWDGTCVAVRLHARALATTGVPMLLKSFSNVVISEEGVVEPQHVVGLGPVQAEVGALRDASIATLTPAIKHMVVRDATHLHMAIFPRGVMSVDPVEMVELRRRVASQTILYTVWERDRVEPAVAQLLSRVAECWVPCSDNAQMLKDSGVTCPIIVVPHPFDPASDLAKLVRRKPIEARRFYSIGAWQPRKGYDRLIRAFLLAFVPDDDTSLTLKLSGGNWPGYATPQACLEQCLAEPVIVSKGWTPATLRGKLRIVTGRLPADQILRLHFENNIYLSASHGEAWNLPAFDAKVAGNRVVHVPYGGTRDFCDSSDTAVKWDWGPADPSYRWEPDARWANYTFTDLTQALRSTPPPLHFSRSEGFEKRFSMETVGRLMLERVLGVLDAQNPPAAEYLRRHAKL